MVFKQLLANLYIFVNIFQDAQDNGETVNKSQLLRSTSVPAIPDGNHCENKIVIPAH